MQNSFFRISEEVFSVENFSLNVSSFSTISSTPLIIKPYEMRSSFCYFLTYKKSAKMAQSLRCSLPLENDVKMYDN